MMFRAINESEAKEILQILTEESGFLCDHPDDFIHSIGTDLAQKNVCTEYRFMGALGYGGKFRNNGNRDNTPHVDCYREDETPERKAMIERANKRLAELFK